MSIWSDVRLAVRVLLRDRSFTLTAAAARTASSSPSSTDCSCATCRFTSLIVSIGLILGVAGAFAVGQVLQGILAGVSGRDPATLIVVPMVLVAVAFLAGLIPARRAMRINPVDALRAE